MQTVTVTFTDDSPVIGLINNVLDAAGKPITFKAPPTWLSSDSNVFSPVVAADGLSCTGTVKTGTTTVTVTGDGVVRQIVLMVLTGVVASFDVSFAPAPPAAPPTA